MKIITDDTLKSLLLLFLGLLYHHGYGQCSIAGLDDTYCVDAASVSLTASPGGGTFSGPGMIGAVFDPSLAGAGVHSITYSIPAEDRYYIKSNIGNPWGNTTNDAAMDVAFGGAGWTLEAFETVDVAAVFSSTTSFVFLEGSDFQALELNAFLTAHLPEIETWVDEGGTLLINASPNEGTDINFGFGGTTLDYPVLLSTATVADLGHPAFVGPNTPTSSPMTGTYYAHGRILGSGFTNLLISGSDVILAEKSWGEGTVMVGAMTTTNWHTPTLGAENYRANLFVYLESLAAINSCSVTQEVEVFALPDVAASVTATEICEGDSVIFTGEGADTYVWDLGVTDGDFYTPGLGSETYTVIGTNTTTTCQNVDSVEVNVNALPDVTAAVTASEICLGDSLIFTGGGADTYSWEGGIIDGEYFIPIISGDFNYTVTGTNGLTGCQDTSSVDILVHELPEVTATVDFDEICLGESIILSGDGADEYSWDFGVDDGEPYTPDSEGTFVYTVTGTNLSTGCQDTADITVIVHALPAVTASVDVDTICLGETVIFNGGGADAYVWDFGVEDGVPYEPTAEGMTTYTVIGTNGTTGCQDTAETAVLVHPLPEVSVSVSADTICIGESVIFTSDIIGADSFEWDNEVEEGVPYTPFEDGTTIYTLIATNMTTGCQNTAEISLTVHPVPEVLAMVDKNPVCFGETITLSGSGAASYTWNMGVMNEVPFQPDLGATTFIVTGTNGSTGCTGADSIEILVNPLPEVDAGEDQVICLDETYILSADYEEEPTMLEWSEGMPDGSPIWASQEGEFIYTVTIWDENVCFNSDEVLVTVIECDTILVIPSGFSPNNDGVNDYLEILGANGENIQIVVFSEWGNKLYQSEDYQNDWDGTNYLGAAFEKGRKLPAGTYYYVVQIGEDVYKNYVYIAY